MSFSVIISSKIKDNILYEITRIVHDCIYLNCYKRIPSANIDNCYDSLNIWHENLLLAKEVFQKDNLLQKITGMIEKIKTELICHLDSKAKEIIWFSLDKEVVENLLQLKDLTSYFTFFRREIDFYINKILSDIKNSKPERIDCFRQILDECEGESEQIARLMIRDHEVFKSARQRAHNAETQGMDYTKVLYSLEEYNKNHNSNINSDLDVEKLKMAFENFNISYTKLVNDNTNQIEKALPEIIRSAKSIACSAESYDKKNVLLAAHLFSYWTLNNAKEISISSESQNNSQEKIDAALLQPHASQVIAIFRFLGIDTKSNNYLANHMVQIGTGEGKSVTLAMTACILALNGYDVDCACYSEYLSERDYRDFEHIFNAFGLKENIQYGTFNQLSEHYINQDGDVREMVECFIKKGDVFSIKKNTSGRRRIFLVDEVDVFFSKDFYGKNYYIFSQIRDPSVLELIKYIWSIRDNNGALCLDAIKSTKEFSECCKNLKDWQPLIEEAVKAMVLDVKAFHNHRGVKYDIENDKITYPTQYHKNSDSLTYRYQTAFAYIFECENKKISSSSCDAHLSLIIDSGSFSFAEVPKKYDYIMGVTGTLETLNSSEMKLLTEEYRFDKFSYMPSTYGKNQLQFAGNNTRDVLIESDATFHLILTREIYERQTGIRSHKEALRPVMVFFSTKEKLDEFYNSAEFSDYRDRTNKLTEDLRDDVKAGYIRKAVQKGVITLMTRGFGRGTDFDYCDTAITLEGGIHVIQTFVSEAIAEETQIKGRTARQGKIGSYSIILHSDDLLNLYSIGPTEIEEMKNSGTVYTTINDRRNSQFQTIYEESLRQVMQLKEEHAETAKFIDVILRGNDKEAAKSFLLKRNEISIDLLNSSKCARTICLMDATGSMEALLTKAKNTVEQMFIRAYQILKDKECYEAFELQFVFYRNYSSKNRILTHSGWESSPSNIKQYLETIKPEGGQGNEAIEIGLSHVNNEIGATNENNITQVILIGDRAPNTPAEVEKNRSISGEKYWNDTQFSEPTDCQKELDKLCNFNQAAGDKKIPIHCFYLDNKGGYIAETKKAFENIAKQTDGKSGLLDIYSPEGAELLTQIVTERILFVIGGDDFVGAYQEKYGEVKSGHILSTQLSFFSHSKQGVASEVVANILP